MLNIEKIKNNLFWDFKFEDEFKYNKSGYTFIIDVYCGSAKLVLYRFTPYGSRSKELDKQPPADMIDKALVEQGNAGKKDGFYYINAPLQNWIKENILKDE
ncbi:MAG: hypothetical protein H0Z40_09000 [Desulfotomaculum sp.]|nr:hypothetical protein [Desulfotomaculum sp.]